MDSKSDVARSEYNSDINLSENMYNIEHRFISVSLILDLT